MVLGFRKKGCVNHLVWGLSLVDKAAFKSTGFGYGYGWLQVGYALAAISTNISNTGSYLVFCWFSDPGKGDDARFVLVLA